MIEKRSENGIDQKGMNITLIAILLMISITGVLFTLGDASGSRDGGVETRAEGPEDLVIDITLQFNRPTSFDIFVHIDINSLMINGNTTSSDELRILYDLDPSGISQAIDLEVNDRVDGILGSSFEGDTLTTTSSVLDTASLENSTGNIGLPVVFELFLTGNTPINDFLPRDRTSDLEGDEPDDIISALFCSGFIYTRNVNLMAKLGQVVTYRIPSSYDPYGDGSVEIVIINTMSTDGNGDYVIEIDATSGDAEGWFLMEITGGTRIRPDRENIDGTLDIDWFQLDRVSLEADINVISINTGETAISGMMPDTIRTPNFIGTGLMRYLRSMGVVRNEDIEDKRMEISNEVELEVEDALELEDAPCSTTVEWNIDGLTSPEDGADLLEILGSNTPLKFSCTSDDDLPLDILGGYELDEVMGLLNGGLRIMRTYTVDDGGDYSFRILLPEHLRLVGESPLEDVGGRMRYDLLSGTKEVGSDLAPEYESDDVTLRSFVDLSGFTSHYVADASMDFYAETSILIDHILFDSSKYEVNTSLDFELEYLSADMIRLLIDMDIVDRDQIEEEMEKQHDEIMGDLSDNTEIKSSLVFEEGTLDFDGDYENMTGENEITITLTLGGEVDAASLISGGSTSSMQGRILPFHFDPILPVRTIERTFQFGEEDTWDLYLDIRLPTGLSVKGWLGNGSDHKYRELETVIEDGYPTLKVVRLNGEGDHILIALEFGLYLPINNITCCFVSAVLPAVLMFLLISVKIIKKARKKKDKGGKGEGDGTEEGGEVEDTSRPEDPWDVPVDGNSPT